MENRKQQGPVLSAANFAAVLEAELRGVGIKQVERKDFGELQEVNFRYLMGAMVTVGIALAVQTRSIAVHFKAKRYADGGEPPSICRYMVDAVAFDPVLFETAIRVLKENEGRCDNVAFSVAAMADAGGHTVFRTIMHALLILHKECEKV